MLRFSFVFLVGQFSSLVFRVAVVVVVNFKFSLLLLGGNRFFFLIFKYFFLSTFFFWCVDLGRPTKPPGALFFFSFKKNIIFFKIFVFFLGCRNRDNHGHHLLSSSLRTLSAARTSRPFDGRTRFQSRLDSCFLFRFYF